MKFLVYFEYNLCGKCCTGHLERVLWRDIGDDLFLKVYLLVKEVVIKEQVASVSRS